ncbi:MAG: MBL fold metallo-hydrolase [Clostridiaceae bacterium]|nr:MBL fold metallo-hydrolase [Clostridiaceae bacterium]
MEQITRLDDGLYLVTGGEVNAGLLVREGHGLLIDCSEACTQEQLTKQGMQQLDGILVTQHRRAHTAAARPWLAQGVPLYASQAEAELMEQAGCLQGSYLFRWMRYSRMRPDLTLPLENVPVAQIVAPGFSLNWRGIMIQAVDARGTSSGALAWLVKINSRKWLFCGAAAMAGGRLHDIWSLQKGFGAIQDYHGILGAAPDIRSTWQRFGAIRPLALVPAYGPVENDLAGCLQKLDQRMGQLQKSIVYSSALNYYFPDLYHHWSPEWPRLPAAACLPLPSFIEYAGCTSFMIRSQDGFGFLIDCGSQTVVDELASQRQSGRLVDLEGVWITHMHYDHTEGLVHFPQIFSCPIFASELTADTLRYPERYFLPCQYPAKFPVTGLRDGSAFRWREFSMTTFEYPGQTLHHGALLVEGYGVKILFVGDSFAPNGFDDYCPQNRVLPGKGRGLRRCLDIIRQTRPDYLINQHQKMAFHFTEAEIDHLESLLTEREQLIELLTGRAAGWALDDAWLRAYPYETEAAAGDSVCLEVHATGHDNIPLPIQITPLLPDNWQLEDDVAAKQANLPALSGGSVFSANNPDLRLAWRLRLPLNIPSGTVVRIPLQVEINGAVSGVPACWTIHIR